MYRNYSDLQDIVDNKELDTEAYENACTEVGYDLEEFLNDHELIAEYDFSDYAEAYAEDIYSVDFSTWPFNCIDWEQASHDMQADYSSIDINGTTYYYQ